VSRAPVVLAAVPTLFDLNGELDRDANRALYKLIAGLLDDPEARRKMGEIGKARVSGPLSWEHSAKALLAAYEAACR